MATTIFIVRTSDYGFDEDDSRFLIAEGETAAEAYVPAWYERGFGCLTGPFEDVDHALWALEEEGFDLADVEVCA